LVDTFALIARAAGANAEGLKLVHGDASLSDTSSVELVGVNAKGKLVDYGAPTAKLVIAGDRVSGLPAGTPVKKSSKAWKKATQVIVVADAGRKAKDVRAAIASIDPKCMGFATAAGTQLGAVVTSPCPAPQVENPAKVEYVQLIVRVTSKDATVMMTRANEAETVARTALAKKLADYKSSSFFAGKGCRKIEPEGKQAKKLKPDEGSAMGPLADMDFESGRCDILLAFDDDATFGDVVDAFGTAIASGFTSPRWVPVTMIPKVKWSAPVPPKPETPEVAAAHKKRDEAHANLLRVIKDQTMTVDQIKAATAAAKAADDDYKAAKKKAKAAQAK
jgi:hypothetical protein